MISREIHSIIFTYTLSPEVLAKSANALFLVVIRYMVSNVTPQDRKSFVNEVQEQNDETFRLSMCFELRTCITCVTCVSFAACVICVICIIYVAWLS